MTVWERDGDTFAAIGDDDRRHAVACPDCGGPWPGERIARGEPCPGCGLPVDDLRDAADFLDRLAAVG